MTRKVINWPCQHSGPHCVDLSWGCLIQDVPLDPFPCREGGSHEPYLRWSPPAILPYLGAALSVPISLANTIPSLSNNLIGRYYSPTLQMIK